MSGRDLRAFLSSHKASTFNTTSNEGKLLGGYLAGVNKRTFKPVDYDQLLENVKQQKASGQSQLLRVKKLSKTSKESKEKALLKAHHEAWDRMHGQLVSAKVSCQVEVEEWKSKVLESRDEELKDFVLESTDLESQLYEEREEFERCTVDPLWSVRIDLKGWLETHGRPEEDRNSGLGHEEIMQQLRMVKEQQNRIQAILEDEYDTLQSDLNIAVSQYYPDDSGRLNGSEGIPQEALNLACPDAELKESALQEFLSVDEHYRSLLEQLEQSNEEVLSSDHGGWSQYDAEKYVFICEQYPSSLPRRRALVIDRLKRELPHKIRADIVSHESWCSAKQHYIDMKKTILKSWEQSRRELLARVVAAFVEAESEYEAKKLAKEERDRQAELCKKLYEKVSAWREAKLETAQLEADLEAQRLEEEEHWRQIKEEEKHLQREREKLRLKAYHEEIERQHQLERESVREREREAEVERKKRLKVDRKRVEFRQILGEERGADRKEREERAIEEQKKRERRLEKLRQQVQVNVSTDPLRVLKETKSTQSRQTAFHDLRPELDLQHPLFSVHSFTDRKVTSDLRFKIGEALRKAGLQDTDYGRRVLSRVPPPQPPRRDQCSTVFNVRS